MKDKTVLMYGTYKTDELEAIRNLFRKAEVDYTIGSHPTARGIPYYVVEGLVTKAQQNFIRSEIKQIEKTNYHWGKMTFSPMM